MAPRRTTNQTTPAEQAHMPILAGQSGAHLRNHADIAIAHETPESKPQSACASEDLRMINNGQALDSSSDADTGGSEFDPVKTQPGEEDGDGDALRSQEKQVKKAITEPTNIEELRAEWEMWEGLRKDLQLKKTTSILSKRELADLSHATELLEELVRRLPTSDSMRKNYLELLSKDQSSTLPEARKRKSNVESMDTESTIQSKKARLNTPALTPTGSRRSTGQSTTKEANTTAINEYFQQLAGQSSRSVAPSTRGNPEVRNIKKALRAFGGEKLVHFENGSWLVQGMKTPLFGYQFDGAGWMVQRERSRDLPNGGILADEMGCGKTITMLSVILRGKPAQKAPVKSNLLLVQSDQMANQWMDQIDKHCSQESLPALRWGRQSRLNAAVLSVDQIILITYSEVERAWSRVRNSEQSSQKRSVASDQEHLLFRTEFHRLILDECQQIKNHNSATARAVFQLHAKLQWLISATPAPNKPDEYYSYLKVLKLPNTETIREFHKHWTNGVSDGRQNRLEQESEKDPDQLEKGLEKFLLRRTRHMDFAGVKIFEGVPESVEETLTLTLSAGERALYDVVVKPLQEELEEKKQQIAERVLDAFENETDANSSRGGYMVSKILSLYKLTAHPFLIESMIDKDNFPLEQLQDIRASLRQQHNSDTKSTFLDQAECTTAQIVEKIKGGQSMSLESQPQTISWQPLPDSSNMFNMDLQLDYNLGEKAEGRTCRMCADGTIPSNAVLAQCGHYFCKKHFDLLVSLRKLEDPDEPASCHCGQPMGQTQNVDQTHLAAAYAIYKAGEKSGIRGRDQSQKHKKKSARKRGDDFNGCQPKGERSHYLELSDREYLKVPLAHSSKTLEILKVILRWQGDAPDDKIIIFTQWLLMAKIIGRILEDANMNFLYYFGDMTSSERAENLRTFETEKNVKVIIMGFRCAGQGLDMPHANRVVLVDPWWNEDGERQAFARVLRKVQTKKTFFIRLMVENSIDMRISDIQQSKREMNERLKKEDDPWKRAEIELEYASIFLEQVAGAHKSGVGGNEKPPEAVVDQQDLSDRDANSYVTQPEVAIDSAMNLTGRLPNKKQSTWGSLRRESKLGAAKSETNNSAIKQEDTSEDTWAV